MFWNATKDFKMMLRHCDSDAFDVCIVCDPDDENYKDISDILQMEYDGYFDECCFVLDSFSYPTPEDPEVGSSMHRVNQVYAWRKCMCAKYFIKQPSEMQCLFCLLSFSGCEVSVVCETKLKENEESVV
jgi:hypothetical protein